jgi:hypothetical protein
MDPDEQIHLNGIDLNEPINWEEIDEQDNARTHVLVDDPI